MAMGICKTFKHVPAPHAFVFPVVAVNFRIGLEPNLSRLWEIIYCPDDTWADDHFNSNELKLKAALQRCVLHSDFLTILNVLSSHA